MAYKTTVWVDGETPINAENLNKLENGVAAAVVSVNGIGPDENGNVEITIPDSSGNANGGMSETAKALLVAFMRKCVTEGSTDSLIDQFEAALSAETDEPDEPVTPDEPDEPVVTLSSISAVCAETEAVEGTPTSNLTITVTAHYSDGTSEAVTGFTLTPATIAVGANTVVITYSGKTTSVNVVGTAASAKWLNNGTFTLTNQGVVGREFAMTVTNNNHVVIQPNENSAQTMSYPQNVVDISNGLSTTEYGTVARLQANENKLHLTAGDVVETTVTYTSFGYQNRCGLYMLTPDASDLDSCIALIPYPSAAQTDLVQSNTITIESDVDVLAILFTPRALNNAEGKKDEFELSIKVNGSEILGVI